MNKPKALDYVAVTVGFIFIIVFLIFYPLNEIASTPVKATATNMTKEELDIYYLTIHDSNIVNCKSIIVHHDKKVGANLTSEYFFEGETAYLYWIIAINNTGQIKYSNSVSINRATILSDSFQVETTNKLNANNRKLATECISRYTLNRRILISLMVLVFALNIVLIRDIRQN